MNSLMLTSLCGRRKDVLAAFRQPSSEELQMLALGLTLGLELVCGKLVKESKGTLAGMPYSFNFCVKLLLGLEAP